VLIRNPNAKVVRVNIFNGWSVGFSAKVVVQANMEFVLGESGVGFGCVKFCKLFAHKCKPKKRCKGSYGK
jgi:hypothetical protein